MIVFFGFCNFTIILLAVEHRSATGYSTNHISCLCAVSAVFVTLPRGKCHRKTVKMAKIYDICAVSKFRGKRQDLYCHRKEGKFREIYDICAVSKVPILFMKLQNEHKEALMS